MTGYIRAPRAIVQAGGGSYVPIECSVHVSQHQSADMFEATLSLDTPSASFWCDTAPLDVTIQATNDANQGGWRQMISGSADEVEADFDKRLVFIKGRDKTAMMTDKKTTEKWLNKKPEDIIRDLAGRSGLGADIKGSSSDKAGLKYKDDYNRISEYDNHWNVITRLAKQMGCIAFVKGDTLHVQPYDQSDGGSFTINYTPPTPDQYASSNAITIKGSRNLNLSKKVKVNHKSWQHKEGKAIQSEFQSSGAGSGDLEYTFKGANLTKSQQDELARSKLKEIVSHERSLRVTAPGDVNIDPSMMLQLQGTQTGFDQNYIMSSIDHHWSEDGYQMSISVRNKDSKRGGESQSK